MDTERREIIQTFTLTFSGPPDVTTEWGHVLTRIDPALLREAEENLNDLLPEGYRVDIYEWDEEETPDE